MRSSRTVFFCGAFFLMSAGFAAADEAGVSLPGMKSRVQRGRARLRVMMERCCDIERGPAGGVVDYQAREGGCEKCDDKAAKSAGC